MNDRETIEVHLNVLDEFQPKLGTSHQDCRFLFLGNASPTVQLNVLEQAKNAELTVADTMDLWINIQRDELGELLKKIDGLVLNDAEAKLLAEDENLVRAGHTFLNDDKFWPHFPYLKFPVPEMFFCENPKRGLFQGMI